MSSKLIVVVGATGNQGGSVVDTFLKEPGWKVRGLTRNVNSPAAQNLISRGVEMVNANLDDTGSLCAAFMGAHTIFSATDFWTGYRDPTNESKLALGQTMMEWAHDYELQQCKNVFSAADQTHGLERLIFSALSYATKLSGGKYTHIYHFDSEGRAVDFARSQYPELMEKTSFIQIGIYLTNTLLMPQYQPKKNQDGVFVFSTKMSRDCKLPFIVAHEDTGPLTKALVDVRPGQHLLAYRGWLTFAEFAEIWGRALGVKAEYLPTEPGAKWQGLPDDLRLDIEESAAYLNEFGFSGGDPTVIHPKDLNVLVQLQGVEDWIKKQDWSQILNAHNPI